MVRSQKAMKRIAGFCACILTMLGVMAPCHADDGGAVTVAYIRYDHFLVKEADGSLTGYGADYLKRIAEYTGWKYELVDMEWPAAYDAVKNGQVDFFCVARQTEARQAECDFSLYPVGNEQLNLYALPGSDLYYNDFKTLDGIRIGMPEGDDQAACLERYAQAKGFSYALSQFPSNEAAIDAMKAGAVDAVALVGYYDGDPLKTIGNFGVLPAYMMACNGSALLQEFSDAQKQLYLDDPTYMQTLDTTYYGNMKAADDILLTREEHDYIAASGPLPVAISVDMNPMEYYDESADRYGGVVVDLYGRISELTGLKFDFVRRRDAPELIAQMDAGEVRLIGALAQSENVAQSLHIHQTAKFYDNSMSAVASDFSTLSPRSVVAVPAGYPQFITTARNAGYENVREYETFEKCVRAVYQGEADLTYIISMCEGYLLSHAQYSNLRAVADSSTGYGVCLGVAKGDETLLSILNKALSAIPNREIDEIVVSNTALAVPARTPGDVFAENGSLILLLCVAFFALATYSLVRWQKARQQKTFTRELQQHHDLLERLYESLPCGVFRYAYEAPHGILSYNGACARIYGYEGDFPVVGRLPDAVAAAGAEAAFQEAFDRCAKEGRAVTHVRPITRRDGSPAYAESVLDIVDTPQGKVFQETVIDVTERVHKEQETERRYAQEIHRSGSHDKEMLFLAVFDVTEQTLVETDLPIPGVYVGMSVSEFVHALRQRLQDFHTKDEMDRFAVQFSAKRMEEAYESGQFEQNVTLRRCVNGDIQWLRSNLSLRYNPTTGHLMCFDYIWDVTDDHVTEEIAQRTAFADFECFMSIYIKTGCCLQYDVDASGRQLRSNTHYGETDVIRRLCDRMTVQGASELLRDTELSLVASRLADKPFYQVYATLADEDGTRRDKSLSYFYLNARIGILAMTVSDVTEVRAAEVRHGQLLSDALAAAEKADAAKSQFLSRVSHEIRTPLNAVIGYGAIARNELSEAKTEEERRQAEMKVLDCLTKSDVASKHLLTIINDVLDMSAIESGKIAITKDKFDFKGLISSLTTIFYSQARVKGVDLQVRFDAQMEEWLVGDQMRVNQVLTNLLSNAVKFTPEGGQVLLSIRPETLETSVRVTFTVRDTGIGMSPDYLKRIWEPFEQADAYISRRFGGTGLGLTITKTLVDLMGGTIAVESTPAEGSAFTVELSFDRVEQPEMRGVYDFSHINALIVDDDQATCDYMQLLLNRSNIRSTAVNSGADALTAVSAAMEKNEPYTVCFVDWRMPEMNGLETTRRIRGLAGDGMPIIVITAYDFTEVVGRSAEMGVSRFLSKPLFQSSLFDLLAELCGSPKAVNVEELPAYDFTGTRVLLAEDNAMNMEVASRLLTAAGFIVDRAWNGKEAVEAFEAAPKGAYQAILMDVQMPIMDGYQATRRIRQSEHPEARTIPIIAMTADAFAENITKSMAVGMNGHVSKPIDLPTLFDTLQKNMRRSEPSR